jgi:hypothetical protein
MTQTVQNPDVLNKLLKDVLVALFDQAQGGFEDRTGRVIKMNRLQAMKFNAAGRLVTMGVRQLDRFGDPQKKFEKFAQLTNEHLPTILDIVGEDAIVARLHKIPDRVLNAEIVASLDDAGAHKVAELLGRAVPEWQSRRQIAEAAAAAAAAAVAVTVVATAPVEVAPVDAEPVAPMVEDAAPTVADAEKIISGDESLQTLKQQLALMQKFQRQVTTAIGTLESAIATLEGPQKEKADTLPKPPQPSGP